LQDLFFYFYFFFVGFEKPVSAGTISIRTRIKVSVLEKNISAKVTVFNVGTDRTRDVTATLNLFGRTHTSKKLKTIGAHKNGSFLFEVPASSRVRGRYPLIVTILFHDTNGYPFTALSCSTVATGGEGEFYLMGSAREVLMRETGVLVARVSNKGAFTIAAKASLFLPRSLDSSLRIRHIKLGAGLERTLKFILTNQSGKGGAAYPVFLVLEVDHDGFHHTRVVRTKVRVQTTEGVIQKIRWYGLAGSIPLLAFLAGLLLRKLWVKRSV
jgi:hypothetical protein